MDNSTLKDDHDCVRLVPGDVIFENFLYNNILD